MEAATLPAANPTPADRTAEDTREPSDVADQDERSTAELRRLMDLADHHAHRLVAEADAPLGVLLLVHDGDLDVVTLDGPDSNLWMLPRLLADRRPSSAVLVVASDGSLRGSDGHLILVGETSDGLRDERRFRVRPCGRTRRLTRVFGRDGSGAHCAVPRLFPPRVTPTA